MRLHDPLGVRPTLAYTLASRTLLNPCPPQPHSVHSGVDAKGVPVGKRLEGPSRMCSLPVRDVSNRPLICIKSLFLFSKHTNPGTCTELSLAFGALERSIRSKNRPPPPRIFFGFFFRGGGGVYACGRVKSVPFVKLTFSRGKGAFFVPKWSFSHYVFKMKIAQKLYFIVFSSPIRGDIGIFAGKWCFLGSRKGLLGPFLGPKKVIVGVFALGFQ